MLFVRAAYVGASDLTSAEVDILKELKDEFKKIALASAFAADASLDSFQVSIWAMAFSVVARHNTWFRNWEAVLSARARVAVVPFKGYSVFGGALEHCLIEDKDKKKVFPSKKKEGKTWKRVCPFQDSRSASRLYFSKSFKTRWQSKTKDETRSHPLEKSSQSKGPKKKVAPPPNCPQTCLFL